MTRRAEKAVSIFLNHLDALIFFFRLSIYPSPSVYLDDFNDPVTKCHDFYDHANVATQNMGACHVLGQAAFLFGQKTKRG